MERNLFTYAFPETRLHTAHSLGVNILTNIQLADYFINSSNYSTVWVKKFSDEMNQTVKNDLILLRTVFAHGVILRQFFMKEHEQIDQNWDQFISWWKELPEEKVLKLIIYGIRETMDYYYTYMPRMPQVEKAMEKVSLNAEALEDPHNRRKALRAVLQSWSLDDTEKMIFLYEDEALIKSKIIRLLEGFWHSGFNEHWKNMNGCLAAWQTENKELLSKSYPNNAEAIFEITGLYPDTNELNQVNRAEDMVFIPVTNLGRLIVLFHSNKQLYVMFQPAATPQRKDTVDEKLSDFFMLFEGLGDKSRLQIIELIAANKEMFAQQIVNRLGMKQSTVSRHLNQLHRSGIVRIRQKGNTKFFSVNKSELEKVIIFLEACLKS
jgi:DNA-binding transcriptional ArsR family regulator